MSSPNLSILNMPKLTSLGVTKINLSEKAGLGETIPQVEITANDSKIISEMKKYESPLIYRCFSSEAL